MRKMDKNTELILCSFFFLFKIQNTLEETIMLELNKERIDLMSEHVNKALEEYGEITRFTIITASKDKEIQEVLKDIILALEAHDIYFSVDGDLSYVSLIQACTTFTNEDGVLRPRDLYSYLQAQRVAIPSYINSYLDELKTRGSMTEDELGDIVAEIPHISQGMLTFGLLEDINVYADYLNFKETAKRRLSEARKNKTKVSSIML